MYWALLNDGRRVIVTNGTTRKVGKEEFFILPLYTEIILEGGFQVVKKSRLKPAEYGSPFAPMRA